MQDQSEWELLWTLKRKLLQITIKESFGEVIFNIPTSFYSCHLIHISSKSSKIHQLSGYHFLPFTAVPVDQQCQIWVNVSGILFPSFFVRKTKVQNCLKRITPGKNALQSRHLLPSKSWSTSGYICHKCTWKTFRMECLFLHFHHTLFGFLVERQQFESLGHLR